MTATESPIALNRLNRIPARLNKDLGRPSAVLVGLMPDAGQWHVIMTERAHHLAHHAGQISFPGGKVDGVDNSLIDTALREAHEEVSMPAGAVQVLGGLDIVVSPAGFVVQPIVGLVAPSTRFVAAPGEVARVLVLPLALLSDRSRQRQDSYLRDGRPRNFWVIDHDRHYIWGLSAAILVDLAARINGVAPRNDVGGWQEAGGHSRGPVAGDISKHNTVDITGS
ncbi:MAG: CoA pyrophosphatase [Rhodospirillaceae bacterium]|nr:CoA pyrophosphatase [Rhodospirillaceae bacterium]